MPLPGQLPLVHPGREVSVVRNIPLAGLVRLPCLWELTQDIHRRIIRVKPSALPESWSVLENFSSEPKGQTGQTPSHQLLTVTEAKE